MDQAVVEGDVAENVDDQEVAMDLDSSGSDQLRIAETSNEDNSNEQEEEEEAKEQEMEQDVEQEKAPEPEPEPELTPAQIQRSLDLKNEFLELFDIAPKLRNILGEIKDFMSNPEVSKADRDEIQALVENKMNDEKAAKKKAKLEEVAKASAPPKAELTTKNELAEAIKNVVGIDLSSLLGKKNPEPAPVMPMTMAPPPGFNCPPQQMLATYAPPQQFAPARRPNSLIKTTMPVSYGKAGFPKEVPAIPDELKVFTKKPEEICPIPSMLKNLGVDELTVAPLPNELLPPQMRKKEPGEYLGPPIRRTLWLAGARPLSSRKLREKENEQYTQDTVDADKFKLPAGVAPISDELLHPKEGNAKKRRNQEKTAEYRTNLARREGSNAMEASLHRDSPIAVKRYHARQLAKETGMTVEEALDEIEEQCREFKDRPMTPPRNSSGGAGRRVRHVDDGHVPVDHSRGIPGIDRPPVGYSGGGGGGGDQGPMAKRRRGGVKEREKQERRKNRWSEQDYDRPRNVGGNGRRGGGGGRRNRYDDGGYGERYYDQYSNEDYSQDVFPHDPYNQESYDGGGGYEGYYETNATGKYGETSGSGGGGEQDNSYDGYYGYNSNSYDQSGYGKNDQTNHSSNDYDARQKPASHYYQQKPSSSTTKNDTSSSHNYYQQNTGQDYHTTYHATYATAAETAEKAPPIDPRKRY